MRVSIEVEIVPAQLENGWLSKEVFATLVNVSSTGMVDCDDAALALAIKVIVDHVVSCHSKAGAA